MKSIRRTWGLLLLSAALLATTARATGADSTEHSYYMMVFATQSEPNRAKFSHTFASFVKVARPESTPDQPRLQVHTISWLPATLDVVVLNREPEAGVNLDLDSTLRWAMKRNERIIMWGPYKITPGLYDRAVAQEARLRSNTVLYKAVDRDLRPRTASNCIHAVSDISPEDGLLHVGTNRGQEASQSVVNHLRQWIINPEKTHVWLIDRMELRSYPIELRE